MSKLFGKIEEKLSEIEVSKKSIALNENDRALVIASKKSNLEVVKFLVENVARDEYEKIEFINTSLQISIMHPPNAATLKY